VYSFNIDYKTVRPFPDFARGKDGAAHSDEFVPAVELDYFLLLDGIIQGFNPWGGELGAVHYRLRGGGADLDALGVNQILGRVENLKEEGGVFLLLICINGVGEILERNCIFFGNVPDRDAAELFHARASGEFSHVRADGADVGACVHICIEKDFLSFPFQNL